MGGSREISSRSEYDTITTHDNLGRLKTIKHKDAIDTIFADYDWTYDAASRITKEIFNGTTTNFTYDDTNQLAGVSGGRTEGYSYDLNGNRTNSGYVTGTNNRLLEDPTWNYAYDNEGNLVTKTHKTTGDVWSFSYDHLNRLAAATLRNSLNQVSKDARYAYDVFGQRIEKQVDGDGNGTFEQVGRSAYLDGMAFADFDGATTLTTRYFVGDHIDELLARISASGTVAWYLPDNLGSVRHLVDNTGSTIATLSYDSFGKLTSAEDADADRFRFTGREYDAETGLYYYRARYYDPNTGRFLEQDPIGFAAGDANLYRYVEPPKWILGKRFLLEEVKCELFGQPFEWVGICG